MPTTRRGLVVAGVEATLLGIARCRGEQLFELRFEQARRSRLTTPAAMRAYLDRHGASGRTGVASARAILAGLADSSVCDSDLEVLTDRLLRSDRRVPRPRRQMVLTWDGVAYRFDFVWPQERVVLETNGRTWHDDPTDFERDNQKWSVPGALGYRLVMATWEKVTRRPQALVAEVIAALGV